MWDEETAERSHILNVPASESKPPAMIPAWEFCHFSHSTVGKAFLFPGLNELQVQVTLESNDQTANFRLYPSAWLQGILRAGIPIQFR